MENGIPPKREEKGAIKDRRGNKDVFS